ncbi:MAG: hypothetical protein JWQ85_1985 [Mucilaginibacter sp.]|jgi:hypothetical protein|nr:hypothetical protein [Mucilaginibacter sp.]
MLLDFWELLSMYQKCYKRLFVKVRMSFRTNILYHISGLYKAIMSVVKISPRTSFEMTGWL